MLDFTTIIGMAVGILMLLGALQLSSSILLFINVPSMMITFGGAILATITQFTWSELTRLPGIVRQAFIIKHDNPVNIIKELSKYADIARRDGILALEGVTEQIKNNDFLVRGLQLAVDGTDPEVIQQMLNTELDNMLDRHRKGKKMIEAFAIYAPSFGMLGTLIGLIAMLANTTDPTGIARNMSIALLTTLYGVVATYIICRPLFLKLEERSKEEALIKEMIIKGIMSIQSGDNPRVVEQKLRIFLEPRLRELLKK